MKRTVIYDEQIIRGVAEITNNWSAHKNRFIKFATPYWVKFYGEQGLRHLIDKINKSDVPLPCRLGSFDYFNVKLLMFYCITIMRGFRDFRETFSIEVENVEAINHAIDYDAAAERFLAWNTYTPEEESFRPKNDYDFDNSEKFNRIFQQHIHLFMKQDEIFSCFTAEERERFYGILLQRILDYSMVKQVF